METEKCVQVERDSSSGVVVVTLNRPTTLNAISEDVFDALHRAIDEIANRPDDRAVVVTGRGRGFCSGLDLSLARTLIDSEPLEMLSMLDRWSQIMTALHETGKPAIAAVNGPALGGGLALALACDVRFVSPDAAFSVAFIRVGFTGGDMGVSYLLPRIVGLGAASDLMLTGRTVSAEEAAQIGLANRIVPAAQLIDEAQSWAALAADNDARAVALTKHAIGTNIDAPSLGAALALENRNQSLMALSGSVDAALENFKRRSR